MTLTSRLRSRLARSLDYLEEIVRPRDQPRRQDLLDTLEALGIRQENLLEIVEGTELLFYRLDRDELRDLVRRHATTMGMDQSEHTPYHDPDHLRALVVSWSARVMEERRAIAQVLLGREAVEGWQRLLAAEPVPGSLGEIADQPWPQLTPTQQTDFVLQGCVPSIPGRK